MPFILAMAIFVQPVRKEKRRMGFLAAWIAGILEIMMPGRGEKNPDKPLPSANPSTTPSGPAEHPSTIEI
jgi:hypothetical protein